MLDGLTRRAARASIVTGGVVVENGACHIAAMLEVRGKLRGELARALTEGFLESITYHDMQAPTTCGRQTLVQRRAVERVPERIAARERSVRPGFVARVPQEQSVSRELSGGRLDRLSVLAERGGDGRGAELFTCRTRDLQDLAFPTAQAFQLQLDQATQIVRNRRGDVLEPTGERPLVTALDEHAPRDEIVRDVDDEQRIAFGSRIDRVRKR